MKNPAVYLLASQRNGTLYVGVTSDLIKRTYRHKHELTPGFTKRHAIKRLVGFEIHDTMESAIAREKAIKKWRRAWKIELIERTDPQWRDRYEAIV